MAATAAYFDVQLIAQDAIHAKKTQAAIYRYALVTIGGLSDVSLVNHNQRKNYAFDVLNNFPAFSAGWNWAVAQNQTLANDVLNLGNAQANFPTTTVAGAAAVTTAVEAAPDGDYDNAVATYWNLMANA
jgi:hypothetical protein